VPPLLPSMSLPPHAQAKLAQAALAAKLAALVIGHVWWLPKKYVRYRPPDKERPCLIVALEGDPVARVHFVAGTTKGATGPTLAVVAGEVGTPEDTEFDFDRSFVVEATDVINDGAWAGQLPDERLLEVTVKIAASTLIAVQRLTK
jgi:mRNA-degrading endonuclease toxin of MazEF toxin-antitoxin module